MSQRLPLWEFEKNGIGGICDYRMPRCVLTKYELVCQFIGSTTYQFQAFYFYLIHKSQ